MTQEGENTFIMEWGAVMRLARRASMLASEDMRKSGRITDPLDGSIMLYTDDPTTATWFAASDDMAAICKTSAIEGVAIVMGKDFSSDSFEAERQDLETPRIAALWFPASPGEKCPRCRNFTKPAAGDTCPKCEDQIVTISQKSAQ